MSEEMAVSDNTTGDEATVSNETEAGAAEAAEQVAEEVSNEDPSPQVEDPVPGPAVEEPEATPELEEPVKDLKEEPTSDHELDPPDDLDSKSEIDIKEEFIPPLELGIEKGIKRRASAAFSDIISNDFKGFDHIKDEINASDYYRILERLEAEVTAASKGLVRLRTVMGIPAMLRASKRQRKDTDGSRPSSALSSRSEGDGGTDASSASSPHRRRATTEMSSPLLRVPLERGWKRELVYRAALDSHSRRNADIYYYSPQGKKLRSTREVSEHLAGTGLTLENFSFFKEPLGIDDPEKEIIRDAKLMSARKAESPAVTPAAVEGKRTPKPKQPKGASPEPAVNKTPAAKLKVKSVGSRLSNSTTTPTTTPTTKQKKAQQPTTPSTDNNNSSSWKKPRGGAARRDDQRLIVPTQPRPNPQSQPCSLTCGRGVPSLSCGLCLCLYHAPCAGYTTTPPPIPLFCKNCRKSSSPPPLPPAPAAPRRPPVTTPVNKDKRVMLRMKVSGGTPDGERVWAVSGPSSGAVTSRARTLPQSLVVLNGRRFVVVPRSVVQPQQP